MKALLLSIFALAFTVPAFAASCGDTVQLKKDKVVFDLFQSGAIASPVVSASCVGPGYHCSNSGECCGASFCRDGVCSDTSNTCRDSGAACSNSGQCCGSMFCRDGYCNDPSLNCNGQGAHCNNSGECCGASFCRDGFCS